MIMSRKTITVGELRSALDLLDDKSDILIEYSQYGYLVESIDLMYEIDGVFFDEEVENANEVLILNMATPNIKEAKEEA